MADDNAGDDDPGDVVEHDRSPQSIALIALIGLQGGRWFGAGAERALLDADVVMGASRHLRELPAGVGASQVTLPGSVIELVAEAGRRSLRGQRVVVVVSGDPGFFGLTRLAARRLGPGRLRIHPAPSAISLAFARLGEHWEDARVVSAHGRPLAAAVEAIVEPGPRAHKVAVLVSADQPPEAVGSELLRRGTGRRRVAVCSRLGSVEEEVTETDLEGLAAGTWDPLSVVVIRMPEHLPSSSLPASEPVIGWGRPEDSYAHRHGMITKAEVRAVVLGKLGIPAVGVVWDVGAGSGSVSAEVAALAPDLEVFAIERNADDVARIRANVEGLGVTVVEGEAPGVFDTLPDPDRVFVGGGGLDVLDAALGRIRPGGMAVATYATLERAAEAGRRLGNLIQLSVARGIPVGPGGALRLAAENPVFVCWGAR